MNRQAQVERLSGWGRGGDTMMAHLTPGEMILPRGVQGDEELMAMIEQAMMKRGLNPTEYVAGHQEAKVNPHTGAQEFYEEAGTDSHGRGGERSYGGGRVSDGKGGGISKGWDSSGGKESPDKESAGGNRGYARSERDDKNTDRLVRSTTGVITGANLGANQPAPAPTPMPTQPAPAPTPMPTQPAPVQPTNPAAPSAPVYVGNAPVWNAGVSSSLPVANLDADTIAKLNALSQQITVPEGVRGENVPPVWNQNPAMQGVAGGVSYLNRVVNRDNGKEEYKYANGRKYAPSWGGGNLYNRLVF